MPTTSVQVHSAGFNSMDMWPQSQKSRNIKYQFELLETALQTSGAGHSVIHCPDFITRLYNLSVKSELKLFPLSYPLPIKKQESIKIFLVAKKENLQIKNLQTKFVKFVRSLM